MGVTPGDLDIVARTIYGEARSEEWLGKIAVAWVIRNRTESARFRKDHSYAATCLRMWQFSCWLPSDPNRSHMERVTLSNNQLRECYSAFLVALNSNKGDDPTHGATHYYADYISAPSWAENKKPCFKVGRHLFFNDID